MNGVSSMVSLRSRADGSVRVAITAGTEQPNPMSRGTMERPERPSLRRSLSVTKAMRAIYPLSSIRLRKKNSIMIMGTKLSTLPTPPNMPSFTSDIMAGLISAFSIPATQMPASHWMPPSSQSWSGAPSTSIESHITRHITTRNMGIAVQRPVSMRSMRLERMYSLLFWGLTTVCAQRRSMNENRISAMAAARSMPRSSSICRMICSIISFSFWVSFRALSTCESPSTSLPAAKRAGMPARSVWSSTRCIML